MQPIAMGATKSETVSIVVLTGCRARHSLAITSSGGSRRHRMKTMIRGQGGMASAPASQLPTQAT